MNSHQQILERFKSQLERELIIITTLSASYFSIKKDVKKRGHL